MRRGREHSWLAFYGPIVAMFLVVWFGWRLMLWL